MHSEAKTCKGKESRGNDKASTAKRSTSIVTNYHNEVLAWVIATEEVNDFLAQAPPRVASRGIRQGAYGSTGFLTVLGAGFLLLGGILVSGMLIVGFDGEQPGRVELRGTWPYLLMILPLMGGVVLFFGARSWWCLRRILRYGVCEQAKVVKVLDTGLGNHATFRTESGLVIIRLRHGPASLARSLQERGETVRLLVDPKSSHRALWIEGWAMDAYE